MKARLTPRIPPLQPPYEPDIDAMLKKWMPPGSPADPLKLFRTLAVHPDLCARMRPLGAGILGHGLVGARERELMIQRTCALNGAEYEWGVHAVAFGDSVGLTPEDSQAVATGAHDRFDGTDALVLRLADELHERSNVTDELWAALEDEFDHAQLIELIATAGWYRLISYVINVARIEHEPWAARIQQG